MKKLLIISLILISINSKSFAHGGNSFISLDYGQNLMSNNKFGFRSYNSSIALGGMFATYGNSDYSVEGLSLLGIGIGVNYSNWKSTKYKNTSYNNCQLPLFLRIKIAYPDFFLIPYCGLDFGANINLGTTVNGNYLTSEYNHNRSGILINPSLGLFHIFKQGKSNNNYDCIHTYAQISWNNNLMFGKRGSAPHVLSYFEIKFGIAAPLG